jgi:hypothetical protein
VSLDFGKINKSELKNLWFQLLQELNAPFDFHERTGKDMRMPGQLFFPPSMMVIY